MSWYEEAGMEISETLGLDTVDGYDEKAVQVAAIIAKRDPHRWIPVTERLPEVGVRGRECRDVEVVHKASSSRNGG